MKKAALYARVSTNNGHQDPAMQLRELREYCDRRGLEIADEYVDNLDGFSGLAENHSEPSECNLRWKGSVGSRWVYNCNRREVKKLIPVSLSDAQPGLPENRKASGNPKGLCEQHSGVSLRGSYRKEES